MGAGVHQIARVLQSSSAGWPATAWGNRKPSTSRLIRATPVVKDSDDLR